MIMLATLRLRNDRYGVTIARELEDTGGRPTTEQSVVQVRRCTETSDQPPPRLRRSAEAVSKANAPGGLGAPSENTACI